MLLSQLVHSLDDYQLLGGRLDVEITQITDRSTEVVPQSMFICVCGYRTDGHQYIEEAKTAGAVCILLESCAPERLENLFADQLTVIQVSDSKKAMARLAATFYGNSANRLYLIGVTGTKGKTTTAWMIRCILSGAGVKTGLIGTLGAECDELHEAIGTTTPDAITLHRLLSEMEQLGCTHVILEVSSQALMCDRVYGVPFQIAVYTNLFPDHIGPREHQSMEEYAYWKSRLFTNAKLSILNMAADQWALMRESSHAWLGYYLDRPIENCAEVSDCNQNACPIYPHRPDLIGISDEADGRIRLTGLYEGEIHIGLPGAYNLENALAALTVAHVLEISLTDCNCLGALQVPGRTEVLDGGDYRVIIDYAHNESSMINLLTALRRMKPTRLICIYGSGGNRSPMRRLGMGRAGGKLADLSVLTEDNSRFESLSRIISGLIEGVEEVGGDYQIIMDRREAIHHTISHARPGDLIAIIGKGHEEYQEIGSHRYPFSDRAEARLAMIKRNASHNK
ncbi:MAG: UDP-N-acetylmuramoyl-L-alanyl-D-glutamate--2,6-diaminopimelate ligase [Lachnospiraceae bacterium]|nr:UDP-N-acetylmuramoyl-L-alanyl-D-glutamate--2,6-diaminopimelate ligase [Lachnospiraceae bacterium]